MRVFGFDVTIRRKNRYTKRYYQGAKSDRLMNDWLTTNLSADEILKWYLKKLRSRSRDLERNDDYMRNFLRKLESNIVGSAGIVLQSKVRDPITGELDIKTNAQIEEKWAEWAKLYASTTADMSLRDVMKIVLRSVARDGEVFIRKVRGYNNPYRFALQILEADYCNEDLNKELPNGNRIIMGVEVDRWSKPIAYYLFKKHPEDRAFTSANQTIRVPADEIIHLFIRERPSQTRGIPWITSAMLKLRMLGAYEEAEVVAARVAAAKMGFFTESPEGAPYSGEVEDGQIVTEVEPGVLERLPPGVDFKAFDPGSPSAEFGDFVKSILRGISAGIGCNYNTLCNDLEGVNYSSLRAGSIEEREFWKDIQSWFIDNFLERIFSDWMEMAVLSGQLDFPFADIQKYMAPTWQARRWDWVDPLNDIQAKLLELKNGLTTRTRICAEKGVDFEDILDELRREKKLMDEYGVSVIDVDNKTSVITAVTSQTEEGGKK